MTMPLRTTNVASLFSAGIEAAPAPTPSARRRRRAALFNESLTRQAIRALSGLAFACHPRRVSALPALIDFTVREWLVGAASLPDPEQALPNGLAGLARDLSSDTLAGAYARGLFARSFAGLLTFWAPSARRAADPAALCAGTDTGELLRAGGLKVSFDTDFDAVMVACTRKRASLTAPVNFSPDLMRAFAALHEAGSAHSFEVTDASGRMVAGGFGVAVGRVFVTEGLFCEAPGAAEAGLAVLNTHLASWGFLLNNINERIEDVDMSRFYNVPRADFNHLVRDNLAGGKFGRWRFESEVLNQALRVNSRFRKAA